MPKPTKEQVKNQYEMELLEIKGVEGVGIQEENGQQVLVVYTSKQTKKLSQKLKRIGKQTGCHVKLEKTAKFQAK